MRKLFIIGIGAGNPSYKTVEAIDVVLVLDKGERKSARMQRGAPTPMRGMRSLPR